METPELLKKALGFKSARIQINMDSYRKNGLSHDQIDSIRKVMDRSGWGRFEAFEKMIEISETKNATFSEIVKRQLWKDYKSDEAIDIQNRMQGNPGKSAYSIDMTPEEFDEIFFTEHQKEAVKNIRKGVFTMKELRYYMGLNLPNDMPTDSKSITSRIVFVPRLLNEGDIFICVATKYIKPEIVKAKKPLCIISYPGYRDEFKDTGIPFIPRKNLGSYVLDLSQMWLDRFPAKTVAISGSIGKTSTTEMIGLVASSDRSMYKIEGNQNTTWQVTKFPYNVKPSHDVYVQECSGAVLGQLEKTGRILKPDIFVLTFVGNGHIGNYDGRQEMLLYEKLALDRQAAPDGVGVVNWDNELLHNVPYIHKVYGFGIKDPTADFFGDNIVEGESSISFDVVEKDGTRTPAVINAIGIHNVMNALSAFAAGVLLGIDRANIVKAIASYQPIGVRQNLVWRAGRHMYLDCFSATEDSMHTAISTLGTISVPEGGRKIAVLADVQMLGESAEEVHRRIGQMVAAENTADFVYFYGQYMQCAYEEAKKLGVNCKGTEDRVELTNWLKSETTPLDLICVKASHRTRIQWVMDDLLATDLYVDDPLNKDEPSVKVNDVTYRCVEGYGCGIMKAKSKLSKVALEGSVNGFNLRVIYRRAFEGGVMKSITIPENVECISDEAFANCTNLEQVVFPSTLRTLGKHTFSGCNALTKVTLPEGLWTIDSGCFADCENLKEVVLPDSVKTIYDDVFGGCEQVTIVCKANSYALTWAVLHGFPVKVV